MRRSSRDPAVRAFPVDHGIAARVGRKVWRLRQGKFAASHRPLGSRSLEIFSTDRSPYGSQILESIHAADVVNLHWVAGMFEYPALAQLARRIPVVWTLHDMNPFTGGCHFDEGCRRFASTCGACPQLASNQSKDVSAAILSRKQSALKSVEPNRLAVVAPSRWLTEQSRKSSVLGRFDATTIPYGLETEVFQPRNRNVIRELMGIPASARVILFVAEGLSNRRKGFDLLLEALRSLGDVRDVYLLAVGGGMSAADIAMPYPVKVLQSINDDRFLSFVYSAADVFAMASRADNLPNTVLEALCCGTPIAGFDVGGVPDMVIPGETGALAPVGDAAALGQAIRSLLENDARREQMRINCRARALDQHTLPRQARDYLPVYERLLGGSRSADTIPARELSRT